MGKSFNRADEESFKTIHRPRARKVREDFSLDADGFVMDDIAEFELNARSFNERDSCKRPNRR